MINRELGKGHKSQTADEWEREMEGMPCYRPAPPFFDYCLNMGQSVKRYDCDRCSDKHKLRDYIE